MGNIVINLFRVSFSLSSQGNLRCIYRSADDTEMNMVEVYGEIAIQIISHNCGMLGHKNSVCKKNQILVRRTSWIHKMQNTGARSSALLNKVSK